jgi:hypothetical protein
MDIGLNADASYAELFGNVSQFTQLFTPRKCHELEALFFEAKYVERLLANGTSRSQQDHALARLRHR